LVHFILEMDQDKFISTCEKMLKETQLTIRDCGVLYEKICKVFKKECKERNLERTVSVVINTQYGGFQIPENILNQLNVDSAYTFVLRDNPILVEYVRNNPADPECKWLKIVELSLYPWEEFVINDYDGKEWVTKKTTF